MGASMQEKLQKVDEKLERIEERLTSIDVTLAKQHEQLAHHIYRTEIAETNLDILKQELKPVQKHVEVVNTTLKVIGAVASVVTFFVGLYQIFS
jgi:archaellum component FlaC